MCDSLNVVIFGEAGVGKSSVVNLIAGQKVAETSPDPWGCTLESKQYTFQVAERIFNIWDTIGLGEPVFSAAGYLKAIEKTSLLIQQIAAEGGLDLLLFCIPGSGSRISQTMLCNYRLFFEELCEKRAPIALVVTHLENEERMENWWARHADHLNRCGLKFSGHACVTGLPGHEKEWEGRNALKALLLSYNQEGRYTMPFTSDRHLSFLGQLIARFTRPDTVKQRRKQLERVLRDRHMMHAAVARRLAESLISPAVTPATSSRSPPLSKQNHKSEIHTSMHSSINIILFGETGAGKSSVINLIAEKELAKTSRDACGCTLESKQYTFEVTKKTFNVWDTIGLGEP